MLRTRQREFTSSQTGIARRVQIGLLQVAIMVLTLFTALYHLQLALDPTNDLRVWFALNCLGYIVLLAGLYLPQTLAYHRMIRYALIAYTAITIVAWFILAQPYDMRDLPIKIAEVALIALLLVENEQARKRRFS